MNTKKREKRAMSSLKQVFEDTTLSPGTARRMQAVFWDELSQREKRRKHHMILALSSGLIGLCAILLLVILNVTEKTVVSHELEYTATIEGVQHGVSIIENDERVSFAPRTKVHEGAHISTVDSAIGKAKMAVGPHRININPGSKIHLRELKKEQLGFNLQEGRIELAVAKLPPAGSLVVQSGNVTVQVVGTQFSVEKHNDCVSVDVTEGVVEVRHHQSLWTLHADDTKTICENGDVKGENGKNKSLQSLSDFEEETDEPSEKYIEPSETTDDPTVEMVKETPKTIPFETFQKMTQPSKPISNREHSETAAPTPEEMLFMNAKSQLQHGRTEVANDYFRQYLDRYPKGLFSEDALFHLTKTAYRLGEYQDVLTHGKTFLSKYNSASLPREAQIRILCGEIWMTQNADPHHTLELISPLISKQNQLSLRLQKQLISLLLQSSCRAKMTESCQKWSHIYIDKYPDGSLSTMVNQYLESD